MTTPRLIRIAATLAGVALAPEPAAAQFYKGKQISILVAGTAGGGIDIGARIMSRHLGKYLPGNPTVVVQLMPGAGGIRVLDHMKSLAAKDGTVIGTVRARPDHRAVDRQAASILPHDGLRRDRRHGQGREPLHRLGRVQVQDHRRRQGKPDGGRRHRRRLFHRHLSGRASTRCCDTKFKVITGYQGSQETIIAIERGEVDGRCGWGWSSLKSTKPDWVRDKKINFLLQLALDKNPNIDAPLVMDLVKDEATRQMMTLMFGPLALNKPFFGPPGMAAERTAELRKAFTDAMNDTELRAEVLKTLRRRSRADHRRGRAEAGR